MNRKTFISTIAAVLTLSFLVATSSAQNTLIWDAVAESDGVTLASTYTELYFDDRADQKFEVRISNARPLTRLKVFIRGISIGVIDTDGDGFGRLTKGRPGVLLDVDGRPDAPRIETGDEIMVRSVTRPQGSFIAAQFFPR